MKPWKWFLLLMGMLTTGCAAGEEEEKSEETPPSAPSASVIVDEQEYDLPLGTTRWTIQQPDGSQKTIQTDRKGPRALADDNPAVEAGPGTSADLQFENDQGLDRVVGYQWAGKEREKAGTEEKETSLELPEEPGVYVYELVTHWSGEDYEGEATYVVQVNIS